MIFRARSKHEDVIHISAVNGCSGAFLIAKGSHPDCNLAPTECGGGLRLVWLCLGRLDFLHAESYTALAVDFEHLDLDDIAL